MAVFIKDDPCGIMCIIITYVAIGYADYVVIRHLAIPTFSETLWGALIALAFNVVLFFMTSSHLRAVFSDPGIVPLPKTKLDFSDVHSGSTEIKDKASSGWTMCMKCETYRPPRAHHCRICHRCVRRMDHHCPWINNCVGELNQKFFIQFLFYVGVASVFSIVLVAVTWLLDPSGALHSSKQSRIIHSVILVIESVLFGLFVFAIGCDQIQAILNDETAVELIKKSGPHRHYKSKMALFGEIFGKGPKYLWLCPFSSKVDNTSLEDYSLHAV